MTIQQIKEQLLFAEHPIEKILHENNYFSVSLIGFSDGMMLREKQLENPTKLLVLCGTVKYFDVDKKITLSQYEEFEIPADVRHYIIANEKSICLLTQDRMNQDN